jgi:hypothetical protein
MDRANLPFGKRVWELRQNVRSDDAWYVAVAESLSTSVATIDRRLSTASGLRCRCLTPPQRPWRNCAYGRTHPRLPAGCFGACGYRPVGRDGFQATPEVRPLDVVADEVER